MIISKSSRNKHKAKSEIVEDKDDFIWFFLAENKELKDKEDWNDDNHWDNFDPERIIDLTLKHIPRISNTKDNISGTMDSKESPINGAVADVIQIKEDDNFTSKTKDKTSKDKF